MIRGGCTWRQIRQIVLFLVGVGLAVGLIQMLTVRGGSYEVILYSLLYTSTCGLFCSAFLCYLFGRIVLFPRPLFVVSFLGLLGAGTVLGVGAANLILTGRLLTNWQILIFCLALAVFVGTAITFFQYHSERLETRIAALKDVEIENERLKRIDSETRLQGLQSKLNPHFLFNTLNSAAALIGEDPERAERSLVRISMLYRKVLAASNRTWIPVGEEMDLLRDFLELLHLRFEDRLAFQIDCPDELLSEMIPALILQPLVENAVKHAEEKSQSGVTIRISVEEEGKDRLALRVKDDGPGFDIERTSPGFGLYSVQERLRLAYGVGFILNILSGDDDRGTEVKILVPKRESGKKEP